MLEGRRRRPEEKRMPERRWRRRPGGRRWWWLKDPMRVKASRMSGFGGSSPSMVVQCLSLLMVAIMHRLLNNLL
jgi:hypothetical protein